MKPDEGQQLTDELLKEYEAKISDEYRKAVSEVQAKLDDYLRRFKIKDEAWQRMVSRGEKTAKEYAEWRQQQIMVGRNWEKLRDGLAGDLHDANARARRIVDQLRYDIYAESFNLATYEVEVKALIDSSFALYSREAVERIIRENPELLPAPGPQMLATFAEWDEYQKTGTLPADLKKARAFAELKAAGKDVRWQKGQLQSVTLQSILQGESIPSISRRIASEMGEINHKSTIRYARTAATGAMNAGRQDAYHRATQLGVKARHEWRAVWDGRTRYEHRQLDGQIRAIDEPFEVDGERIMYPGEPTAPAHLIWNCRCRTSAVIDGLEPQARKYRDPSIEGKTYQEWKNGHEERSNPLERPEKIAEAMKWRTINELYRGK